jgi:hypothetical protein
MAKKQVTRMEVDGVVVDIRPIAREESYRSASYYIGAGGERIPCDPDIHYRQKSLYEVYVDDVLRGWLEFPLGWGGEWTLYSMRPQHERFEPSYHKHDDEEKAQYGRQGYYKKLGPGALNEPENWGEHRKRWDDRNDILAHIPKLVAMGRMPNATEMAVKLEQWKTDHATRAREDAERTARYAREREEEKAASAAAALKAEEERVETLMGLESIRDRLGKDVLSNLEMVALTRAIDRYTK